MTRSSTVGKVRWSAMRFVSVFLATVLSTMFLLAPTVQAAEDAPAVPKICDAYIRSQASFKKIPTSFCRRHEWFGECFKHHVDGVEETFGIQTMGTCASDGLSILQGGELTAEEIEAEDSPDTCTSHYVSNQSGGLSVERLCTANTITSRVEPSTVGLGYLNLIDESDSAFMGCRVSSLDYHGMLVFEECGYISTPSRKGLEILCKLNKRYVGLDKAEPATNDICKKLEDNHFKDLRHPLDEQERQEWAKAHPNIIDLPNMYPTGLYQADLRQNGHINDIVSYSRLDYAGCTCSMNGLKPFQRSSDSKLPVGQPQTDQLTPDDTKLAIQLGQMGYRDCHDPEWTIIRIDGADYVLREKEGRDLYSYRNGEFIRICHQAGKYEVTAKPYGRPAHSRHNHEK